MESVYPYNMKSYSLIRFFYIQYAKHIFPCFYLSSEENPSTGVKKLDVKI